MQKLAIIGASDLGTLIAHHVIGDKAYSFVGFYDNKLETVPYGNYLGSTDRIEQDFSEGVFDCMLIGIGYTNFKFRKHFFDYCIEKEIPLAVFKHSSSYVDSTVEIGVGSVILPGCVLDRNVSLEENVFLNVSCTIAHDSRVGMHSFLSPAVNVAGYVSIGDQNFVGIGSTIINNISIVAGTVVGAGAVVVKNISSAGTYVGNPATLQIKKTT